MAETKRIFIDVVLASPRGITTTDAEKIFVIGGEEIYRQTLALAQRLEITEVHQTPDADAWFPEITATDWQETQRNPQEGYAFVTYLRR